MKRLFFIVCALCVYTIAFSQQSKVETFDNNKWRWLENESKYWSATIEDGFLVIHNREPNKKATAYQNIAKSFAKIPLRPNDNFTLTIKYIVPDYNKCRYEILFNVDKKCMMDENEDGEFYRAVLSMIGPKWQLFAHKLSEEDKKVAELISLSGELPGKVKSKGEYPMELVIEKKSGNVSIELNGIELYEGKLLYANPCIGFCVPFMFGTKFSYIKIDEVIIKQADKED